MSPDGSSDRRVAGRYRLVRLLGRGGSATVWYGHDERLDRAVAVKEIAVPTDVEAAEVGRSRALREARAAARLAGEGVVGIYDIIEGDGTVHLVMELVEAPNLGTLVRRAGPLTPPTAAVLGLRILDTLEAANREGIVHRDIKPSNVLIDTDGPRVADFGIARLGDDSTLTATGVVMGTPAYIAPEQARQEHVGPPADLYGLGATLYYAVEGVPPFGSAGSIATIAAVLSDEPRDPRRAGPLGEVLLALLDKDPATRPDAAALRPRLARVARLGGVVDTDDADTTAAAAAAALEGRAIADGSTDGTAVDDAPGDAAATTQVSRPATDGAARAPSPRDRDGARPVPHGQSPRPRRWPATALIAGLVLLALAAWRTVDGGGDDPADRAAAGAGPSPDPPAAAPAEPTADATPAQEVATAAPATDAPIADAEPSPDAAPAPSEPPPAAPADDGVLPALDDVEVPDGWSRYRPDDVPYRIRYPADWQPVRNSSQQTDLRDPATGTYVRAEWGRGDIVPVPDRRRASTRLAGRYDDYRNLGIRATTFRGTRAALWEYRFAGRHAYSLVVNDGETGWGLNLVAPEADWPRARDELWPRLLASWRLDD